MNKVEVSKSKYCLQWESHPRITFKNICSLMEHQSLVDIAICCGNNTLHAHKCILAASSPYFREELEKNSSIEQVLIVGFDFSVMKSIIEFMYCGETVIAEEYFKYLIAAAKLFQLRGLEALFSDRPEYQSQAEEVYIPPPQFLTKKPKYPSASHPFTNVASTTNNILKPLNFNVNDPYNQRRFKRKYIRAEAEKACVKEAQASRIALANLQKEIASAPQVNSFIIEESCTETTVENFIPHTEDNFVDNLNGIPHVQVVDYADIDSSAVDTKPPNLVQFSVQNSSHPLTDLTADKIKHILGNGVQSNVEIMFKTSDGNFVTVTDEVLQNLSKGGLQYQVVDENGHVGEIRDLQLLDRNPVEKVETIQPDSTTETNIDISGDSNDNFSPENQNKDQKCNKEETNPLETFSDNPYDNSFGLFRSKNLTNKSEYDEKPIEFVPIHSEGYIANENVEGLANSINTLPNSNFYNLSDNVLNGTDFMPNLSSCGKDGHNETIGDGESLNHDEDKTDELPAKKSKIDLKFSPDIFFADLPNDTSDNNARESCQGTENMIVDEIE